MDIILKSREISEIVDRCSRWIADIDDSGGDLAIIGIRSKGVYLAERVAERLGKDGKEVFLGTLDITLYRDDLDNPDSSQQPEVRSSDISFDVDGMSVILIDDVLNTGRTVRAAMDALMEFGRPKSIKLAVLVDRGGRELPIQPDFVGHKVDIDKKMAVTVSFKEYDDIDQVAIE